MEQGERQELDENSPQTSGKPGDWMAETKTGCNFKAIERGIQFAADQVKKLRAVILAAGKDEARQRISEGKDEEAMLARHKAMATRVDELADALERLQDTDDDAFHR